MDENVIKRIMPNDLAAEQSVIGAMLLDANAITAAADILTGDDFYNLRKFMGLTQDEFGKVFDVKGATIYSWEHGLNRPNLENRRKIRELHASGVLKSCKEEK